MKTEKASNYRAYELSGFWLPGLANETFLKL